MYSGNYGQKIEYAVCPLCKNVRYDIVYDNFYPYKVVRCRLCGLYYLSPRLKESVMLQKYKDSAYFEDGRMGYSSYIEQEESLRATFRRLMINLKRHNLTGGALLEVGCGYGYLLEEGIGYFNPRIGTEFSPQAVKEAQRRADYIFEGGIEQIPPDERFDCIIANQVIEHVYEPQRFLEQLIAHLRPGGRVVIATPDMGSFWRRLMGHHWPSFKIPEHIIFFDKKSLYTLMRQAGLIKISILPYPHAFPLSLIASKLHTPLTSRLGKINLWIPATTIAMYGIVPDG